MVVLYMHVQWQSLTQALLGRHWCSSLWCGLFVVGKILATAC